jgi:L-histidine Nalpha-methyltransferase
MTIAGQTPPSSDFIRDFATEVRRDLALSPKQLQSKYLYNGLGSSLFESICHLPWYRITRAEGRLLARFAGDVVSGFVDPVTLTELGCGSGEKLALIADALRSRRRAVSVHLIDISPAALELSERTLAPLEYVSVLGHRATYEEGLRQAARQRPQRGSMLVLCLGSNIGNFDPPATQQFLAEIRASLRPGDGLLLGADLIKPESALMLAYDDPLGVTAAFNKNVLLRINTELGGDFDLGAFVHRAVWDANARRVEMHLVSTRDQAVRIARADCGVSLKAGEPIWTESSYKYDADEVVAMGETAGFRRRDQWIEPEARFALTLFVVD